jgi:Domain of unknown function (DUF362)
VAAVFDRVVGVYHFLGDRVPRDIPSVEPKPRKNNPWVREGQPVVARVKAEGNVRTAIEQAIGLMGNLSQIIGTGDRVFVKPNLNSADPFPAATDLAFLEAVTELLLESGARVTIGEASGAVWRPGKSLSSAGFPDWLRSWELSSLLSRIGPPTGCRSMSTGII